MSTIEDFENAPIGATATRADGGRAMKVDDSERGWIIRSGAYLNDEQMMRFGYMIAPSAPTTAREALALTWELAHEVKEGQVIPADTGYLGNHGHGIKEYVTHIEFKIRPELVPFIRTVEPLTEPEPDWLDAPAVLAVCNDRMDRSVFVREGDNWWVSKNYAAGTRDLRDVTPLYPEEGQDA